jgi:cytochrome c biogenesis protein CcmG/thiol:disulfide interchange protein DsbE
VTALLGLAAAAVFAGCGGGGAAAGAAQGESAGEQASEPATPVVELTGTDPFTGKQVSLDDYEGKPVVLNFWASWCPPCRDELPALVRFAESHPELAVVGVLYMDAPSVAKRLREQTGAPFPTLHDPRGEIAERLGLQGMPTTFFLDADHRAVAFISGGTDLAGFEEGLRLAARQS